MLNTIRTLLKSNELNTFNIVQRNYWTINFELLKCYKEVKGDLNIPVKYVIGCEGDHFAWPSKFINYKIGSYVNTIRTRIKKSQYKAEELQRLKEMGFIFSYDDYMHDKYLLAFKTYKEKYNSGLVPTNFIIDKTDESWPKECRGIRLGVIMVGIRNGYNTRIVPQLRDMGIVVDNVYTCPDFDRNFAALEVFKQLYGHVTVKESYIVPIGSRYHPDAWGLKLGKWLSDVRLKGCFSEHRDELVALGVDFDVKKVLDFDDIYSALSSYKNINGHVNVPHLFVIPHNDNRYPEKTWGKKLGKCLNNIRWKETFKEHKQRLVDLGVDFYIRPKIALDFEQIYYAFCSYKNINGHVKIPQNFIVPHNDNRYPEKTWGYRLGECLKSIRYYGCFKDHHKKLLELGVKIKTKEVTA